MTRGSGEIIAAGIEVHRIMGPRFLKASPARCKPALNRSERRQRSVKTSKNSKANPGRALRSLTRWMQELINESR